MPRQRHFGQATWKATLIIGIGDDDTVGSVAETEQDTEQAARHWVERELPRAQFPDWVTRRRHGSAGAFLFGQVVRGKYTLDEEGLVWEPDFKFPDLEADLVDGAVRWQAYDHKSD